MATPATDILPLTGDLILDAMTSGFHWNDDGPIFYSFSDGFDGETWLQPGFVQNSLDAIFGTISSYVAADFASVGQFADPVAAALGGANINLSLDGVFLSEEIGDNVLAIGLFPNVAFSQGLFEELQYSGSEGDIFLNTNSIASSYGYGPGQAGFSLILHEVGHTLGLKHPHDSGGTGSPTFDEAGIAGLDIDWMTVMSYDDDFDWNLNAWDPATPMILDVIALQFLYGVNTNTNSGDDTYALQSGTDLYRTIFDAGGADTLDLSGYQAGAYIDLPKYLVGEDQFAPFGLVTTIADREQIGADSSPQSLDWLLGNIETVIGTPFGDLIDGSAGSETVMAGGGFDDIYVGPGDDMVDGGEGVDWVYFLAAFEDSTITQAGDEWIVESALDGRNTLVDIEALVFDYAGAFDVRAIDELAGEPGASEVPAPDDWTLLAGDGQLFAIGGAGKVVGTRGFQDVFVLGAPGTVNLDPSFNQGGDVVTMAGDAQDWSVALSGSLALFFDGDTLVEIPVGPAGLAVEFADGVRTLRFDEDLGQVTIGSQAIGEGFAAIDALPELIGAPSGLDPDTVGRLLLAPGGEVTVAGDFDIFGTSLGEEVSLLLGNFVLDPSFNQGGDLIVMGEALAGVTASLSGSQVVLESEDVLLGVPVGVAGLDISFGGELRTLAFDQDAGAVFIGAQQIGSEPTPLTFA